MMMMVKICSCGFGVFRVWGLEVLGFRVWGLEVLGFGVWRF